MNCHSKVKEKSEKLAPVRESYKTGNPVEWIQIHRLPDYVYFNHRAHISAGVSCVVCHGRIDQMVEVRQVQPLPPSQPTPDGNGAEAPSAVADGTRRPRPQLSGPPRKGGAPSRWAGVR